MLSKTFALNCLAAVAVIDSATAGKLEQTDMTPSLLQTLTESSGHQCYTTSDRNKTQLSDFYGIMAGDRLVYTDMDFTHDESAIRWTDRNEDGGSLRNKIDTMVWKRARDVFGHHTLFGTDGITPADIGQGSIGNCWFMSASAAIAEVPGRMERIFLNTENYLNFAGIYAVNFWTLGVPHTVIVDDYLPLKEKNGSYETLFAKVSPDGAIWGPILEKAFAKYHGNYQHIIGGQSTAALKTMVGAPSFDMKHKETDMETLWNKLVVHDKINDIMSCGTAGGGNHDVKTAVGLSESHAYSLLGVKQLSNGARLVKIRNPWGSEGFKGDWSASSSLWTDSLKAEAGEKGLDDGIFFMSLEQFHQHMESSEISMDTTGWSHSSFLKLNDWSQGGFLPWCGSQCTGHEMTLTSSVEQTVYVIMNTWDTRGISDDCHTDKSHYVKVPWAESWKGCRGGPCGMEPYTMKAGESIKIGLEFDFRNQKTIKDWSVVVWAENTVTLTHSKGWESDKLPVIDRKQKAPQTDVHNAPPPPPVLSVKQQFNNALNARVKELGLKSFNDLTDAQWFEVQDIYYPR